MIYLVLDVQSTRHTEQCTQLNAWVNVTTHSEAMSVLSEELTLNGWVITEIIESSETVEEDYFPPCTSFDAFNEARQSLLALRFLDTDSAS